MNVHRQDLTSQRVLRAGGCLDKVVDTDMPSGPAQELHVQRRLTLSTSHDIEYLIVINHEEQRSIWNAALPIPAGWRAEGKRGSRQDCLSHIELTWTDMRPLSVRGIRPAPN